MLEIRVLGGLSARAHGAPVELPPSARVRALLAWLAVHPGLHSRSVLAGRLRPDALEESARKSLRQAAWALRGALGAGADAWLLSERERLGLSGDPALVRVDLAEFRGLVAGGRLDEAVALAGGDLLAGLDEDWVDELRQEHRAEVVALLGELAAQADAAGDPAAAIDWSRRRATADPLGERAARDLVARLAGAGDRAGAMAAYEALRERLRRELGIVPSAETRELVEQVRRGRPGGAVAPAAAQPPLPAPLARAGRFVGREDALARLAAAWDDSSGGALRIACLAGEPGIGKTRLAAELASRVHAGGALVLYGRSDEEGLLPHQPFVEALERMLREASPEDREALIGASRGDLARLLPAVDAHEPAAEAEADAATARYRAFEAVRALVEAAAARRPVLLVLDDLHWADRPTLLLLRHLGRMAERAPVLLLVTYRDTEVGRGDPLADALADLRREQPLVTIALAGLSDREAAELLGVDPAVAEPLRERADGNPLFLEEMGRHLGEGGAADGGLPPGVKEVIGRRLDRLGEEPVEVLTTAALAGEEIDLALLDELHGPDAALAAVERGCAAGLLVERGPAGRHAFSHALVAETLHDGASAARRARVHARIADALERRPEARPAEVAHHLLAAGDAGDRARAVRWSVAAAEQATALSADSEAAGHYERALAALPAGDPRRGELCARLGDARSRAGARAPAREAFEEAARAARESDDAGLLARAALGAGGLGVTIGPCDGALVALLEEALSRIEPGADGVRARLLGRLATEVYYEDRGRADALSREAVAAARACGDAAAVATALNARRVAIWDIDHARERLDTATEMVAEAERAGDAELVLQARNWRVLDLLELARVEEARAEIEAYAAAADALALPHYRWWVPLWRATFALMEGRHDDAERLGAEALGLGSRAQDPNAGLFVGIQRTWGTIEQRGFAATDRAYIEQGARESSAPWAWETGLAWADAALGRTAEARELVGRLTRDGQLALPLDANWHAALDLCEAVALLGDAPSAERLYAHLAPYAGLHGVVARAVYWYGPVDHYLGLMALTAGDPARAEGHLARALAAAEAIGAGPRAGATRALLDRARSAPAG